MSAGSIRKRGRIVRGVKDVEAKLVRSVTHDFLSGGGDMGARIRAFDWEATPLGSPLQWPKVLQLTLGICLTSSIPTAIYWGPELRLLYNDAWSPIPADKHPWALGRPAREAWADIWQIIEPQLMQVLNTGQGFSAFEEMLPMRRGGQIEETYWNYSFTPIRDETGAVVGIFNQGSDVTAQVVARRMRQAEVARLREFFEQAPAAIALLRGPKHVVELANTAYAQLVGRSELEGHEVAEVIPEIVRQGFIDILDRVYANNEPFVGRAVPVSLQRMPGTEPDRRRIDFVFQPMKDGRGGVTGIFVQGTDVTERVHAEQALRETDERLQLALSASNTVGTWDWDVTQDRLRTDARFARLYGVDPERAANGVPGEEFMTRVHPEDAPVLRRAINVALKTGKRYSLEYRLVLPDGTTRWVLAQGRCAMAKDGRPLRFPGVSIDVTDLKRAQAAQQNLAANLAEERTRLKTLVENLPIGVCFVDADGTPVLANPAYRRFVADHRLPSLSDDVAQNWIGTDQRGNRIPRHRFPVARALRGEVVPGSEFLYRGPQGEECWTRVSAVPLVNADGEVTAVLTVVVDIDQQKRAQETLQRLNEMLESEVQERTRERDRIWDVSEDLLGVADAQGEWLTINPAWTRSLGWDVEEILNKTIEWLEPPAGHGTHEQLAALHDGQTFAFEAPLRARGGEYRMLSWRGVRIEGAIYSVARDVTDKRQREAALEQVQEQLRQSQKMEAVGQLTGGIAHDFNNLLTGIIGSLDLMQTRLSKGRYDSLAKYAKAAITSANRAAALTHRLLAFSRKQPLDPHPVAANGLIASMEDMLRRTMGEGIQLEIATAGALWLTRCDANQLENAILNLAINARDALPNGGRMTIETANVTIDTAAAASSPGLRPGQYICISVADTGIGMAPDVLARAYEPFFTTKPIGQGTGLGLSMIYGFAKQSDGYTRIESQVGVGTTVRIYLPRYQGDASAREETESGTGRYRALRSRTVLIVEDETVVRDLVNEVLRDLGYHTIEAADGKAGLEALQSDVAIDLVVSDVGLPELNGREMIECVREKRPGLKVLFITGYAENSTFGDTTSDGRIQLITKPFPLEVLAQRIRDMIGD